MGAPGLDTSAESVGPATSVLVLSVVCTGADDPGRHTRILFCSLAVLDPMVGHTMDVLSPFIPVLCNSD